MALPNSTSDSVLNSNQKFIENLLAEVSAMVNFALASGRPVSPSIVDNVQKIHALDDLTKITSDQLKKLTANHNALAKLLYPAEPRNILYMIEQDEKNKNRTSRFLPRNPFILKLVVFGLICIGGLLICGFSTEVNEKSMNTSILDATGYSFIMKVLFLSSASGLGATFMILSKIKSKFREGSYHPDMDAGYWIAIVLGIISGIIITEIIPVSDTQAADGMADNKMLLALLGGFSSQLVYNILHKLVHSVESLVTGGEEATHANEVTRLKMEGADQVAKAKLNISQHLNGLRTNLKNAQTDAETDRHIDDTIDKVMDNVEASG